MTPFVEAPRSSADRPRKSPAIVVPFLMVDRAGAHRLPSLVAALARGGAAGVELGFPFSDPIADGPVLEDAASRALRHGTGFLDVLRAIRVVSKVLPTAVMSYANPVQKGGISSSLEAMEKAGASALVVPDLSLEEAPVWSRACRDHGIALALFVAPGASPGRIDRIVKRTQGFLYLVSRYGTTGKSQDGWSPDLRRLCRRARATRPDLPLLVGFGIRSPKEVRRSISVGADGVIVGTALQERLTYGQSLRTIQSWIGRLSSAPVIARSSR